VTWELYDTVGGYLRRMEKWMFDQSYILSHLHLDAGEAIVDYDTGHVAGSVATPFAYPLVQRLQDRTHNIRAVLAVLGRHCDSRYPDPQQHSMTLGYINSWYSRVQRVLRGFDDNDIAPQYRSSILSNLRAIRDIQLQVADAVAFHNQRKANADPDVPSLRTGLFSA
jgi:hypothetical protein